MAKCETCGQELPPINFNKITHVMQTYVDASNGKVDGLYNSESEFLTIKEKKLQEKEAYLAAKALEASKKPVEAPKVNLTSVVSAISKPGESTAPATK